VNNREEQLQAAARRALYRLRALNRDVFGRSFFEPFNREENERVIAELEVALAGAMEAEPWRESPCG
jgi:hypothetical protein